MAVGQVADHRVGGVDRLVGEEAGEAEQQKPEGGRDHAVGEILRGRLDCRAADAGFVEACRVAADDARHRDARGVDAAGAKCGFDRGDVIVERAAGEQDRRDDDGADPAVGRQREQPLQDEAGERRHADDNHHADAAKTALPRGRQALAVERAVDQADKSADDRDRMRHAPPQEIGVAGDRVHNERQREHPEVGAGDHGVCWMRRASPASQSSAAGSEGPPQTVSFSGRTIRRSGG